jgi:tetratricopeptide (TPR) repeat protein
VSRYRIAVALWAAALFTTSVSAQSQERLVRLRGEVTGGPQDQSTLSIELVDLVKHVPIERTLVSNSGAFEFLNVPHGLYQIRVITQDGSLLRQEPINVNQMTGEISLALNRVGGERPSSGSVSVARLKHKIPSKAKKAFAAAQKRSQSGDSEGAAARLREAIALDPDYLEAHNNLGCRLLSLDRPEEAIESFQRAIELDARAPFAHANLATALLFLRRPAEAELAARQALETDGGISKTRYLLGMSLLHQRKYTREAAQSLRQAEDEFPHARLAAAAVLEHLGEVKEAKMELNTYLSSGAPEKRTEVKAWLSRLK